MSELPVVSLFTIVRYQGEFALVEVRMQGDEILSRDVLDTSPMSAEVLVVFEQVIYDRFGKREVLH